MEQRGALAIQREDEEILEGISHWCFSLMNRPVEQKRLGFICAASVHPREEMTFNCCEHNGCTPSYGFTFRAWNGVIYWTHSAFVTLQTHE